MRPRPGGSVGVVVHIPAIVRRKGFVEYGGGMRLVHRGMVLKAVFADVLQQGLEARHLHNGPAAEGFQRIIYKVAVADVGFDAAVPVVRGDAGIAERPGGSPSPEW